MHFSLLSHPLVYDVNKKNLDFTKYSLHSLKHKKKYFAVNEIINTVLQKRCIYTAYKKGCTITVTTITGCSPSSSSIQNKPSCQHKPEDIATDFPPQVQHCHSSLIFSNFSRCHQPPYVLLIPLLMWQMNLHKKDDSP